MAPPPPLISTTSRPFWDALRREQIELQRCETCERWVFYPRVRCPHCASDRLVWRPVSGSATLYTFTVAETPVAPEFGDQVPLFLAVAELDVGVRLATTLVGLAAEDIRIGMALRPAFDHATHPDVTLLRFQPARD